MVDPHRAPPGRASSRNRIWSSLSIVPGRTARTASIACRGDMLKRSIKTNATIVPVRPRPAAQWKRTFSPFPRTFSTSSSRRRSRPAGWETGMPIFTIGKCCQRNCRNATFRGNSGTPSRPNSSCSIKLTIKPTPCASIAERSASRDRCQFRPKASGPERPGACVMPIRPLEGVGIVSMIKGPDKNRPTCIEDYPNSSHSSSSHHRQESC